MTIKLKFLGGCGQYAAGDTAEIEKGQAQRLIAAGVAIPAAQAKKAAEKAVRAAPETRAK